MRKKYILIVEDNPLNAKLMSEYLKRKGYESIIAIDGEMSLEMVSENQNIFLVLMDIGLPNMSGDKAMLEIKKMHPELPVVAQTAYTYADCEDGYLDAGFDDYISKPINFGLLEQIISKYALCEI